MLAYDIVLSFINMRKRTYPTFNPVNLKIALLIWLLFLIKPLFSYDFIISGLVFEETTDIPVLDHTIYIGKSLNAYSDSVKTDSSGFFFKVLTIPDDSIYTFYISTIDYCTDNNIHLLDSIVSVDSVYNTIISICTPNSTDCKASFIYDKLPDGLIYFYDNSMGEVLYYSWDFGDGQGSTEKNPMHTYTQDGIYSVRLNIETADSCLSSYNEYVSIELPKYLEGTVKAGDNRLISYKIYSYMADSISTSNKPSFNASVSVSDGYFRIPYQYDVPYLLYVVPNITNEPHYFPEYFPTYSGDQKCWKEAKNIFPENFDSIQVDLVKRDSIFYGHAFINGNIKDFHHKSLNVNETSVLLLNEDYMPLKFAFFNFDSSFEFNNIPYGDYYLLVDVIGYNSEPISVSLTKENPSKEVNFTMNEELISTVKKSFLAKEYTIYPNPFSSNVNISLENNPHGVIPIHIYDVSGKVVYSNQVEGNQIVTLDLSNLLDGLYILHTPTQVFKIAKKN